MDLQTILTLIAVGGTISGVVLGWAIRSRTARQQVTKEAQEDATIKADVEYIKHGIDALRLDHRP